MSATGRFLALAMCVSVVVATGALKAAPVLTIDPAGVRTVIIDDFNDGTFTPYSVSPIGAITFTESGGTLNGTIAASTNDPSFRIDRAMQPIDATRYSYFRMRENSDYNGTLQVFYSGPAATEHETRSSQFLNIGDTDGYIERRSIFKLPALSPASTVTRVRLDPISATGAAEANFNYDYFIVDQYDTIGLGEFDRATELQGWITSYTTSVSILGSALSGTAENSDPQVYRYDAAINADKYKYLEIRMRRDTGTGAELFWGASGFHADRQLNLNATGTGDGEYHVYWIDMRYESTWTGTINALRVDPATTAGKTFHIDYIRAVEGPSNGTWTNPAGGGWTQNANWSGGLIANGAGSTADFSTLDLTADATVTVDTQRVIGHLRFSDTAAEGSPETYKSWTLNAGTAGALILDVDSGAPTITVGNGAATINVPIAGSRGLTKTGTGRLTLSGANVYSGETRVEGAGVLAISNATALGATNEGTTVVGGNQLRLEGGLTFAAEPLTISGRGVEPCNPTELRGALRSHSGANVWTGPITIAGTGETWISGGTLTITGGITGSSATLRLDGGTQTVTTNRVNLGSAGTLLVNGNALLAVAGNTFGSTRIDYGGTLRVGVHDALPTSVSVLVGHLDTNGALDLNGYNQTIGSLADGGTNYAGQVVTNSQATASTLTINQTANTSYLGRITGNLAVTKAGTGILTLGGTNTHSGETRVQGGGVLTIINAEALGSTSTGTTVVSGSQLRLEGGLTFAPEPLTISGSGYGGVSTTEQRGSLRSNSGNNVWTGPITVSSSVWISSAGGTTGSITLTGGITGSSASLRLDQGTQTVSTNPINLGATGALYVNSNTLLDVAGNSFGTLWIDWGGNLRFGMPNALPAYVSVLMGSSGGGGSGTLNLNGYSQTIGRLADGGTTYASELVTNSQSTLATLTINQSTNSTYQGKITGALALTKQGGGTLTLGGENTYAGETILSGGTLTLVTAGTNNLSGSPLVTVGQNGVLNVTGVTGTGGFALASGQTLKGSGTILGDMTVAAGATVSPGMSPGTLTHTGNEIWAGGGAYHWEIEDADAAPGTGWDMLNISGTLTINATPSSPFLIDVHSLWASGTFDPPENYQWEIATASGGIVGFDESKFSLLTSGADFPDGSSLFITMAGNSLFVNYLVPEPSAIVLLALALLAGMGRLSRRRRR
ncbi:MAG: autotransporter-associated beta strand repeat-containing protein [Patescibacteria group bacterium]|nr:autotransporter-associated beta strand repeat-containing protein [Patescibacteria group bacterium]